MAGVLFANHVQYQCEDNRELFNTQMNTAL